MPIFEGYVIGCGFKDGHWQDMCWKEIGLHAQNMLTIIGSIVNVIGVTYMTT